MTAGRNMKQNLIFMLAVSAAGGVLLAGSATAQTEDPDTEAQTPPPIVLVSKAGRQRAVQESFCVESDTETGTRRRCVDMVDGRPRRLSVVRPRGRIAIIIDDATEASGIVTVQRLGRTRDVARFRVQGPRTPWRIRLRPGAYEVEVEVSAFRTADGRRGDTSGSLGLLVDRNRRISIIPVSALRSGRGPELTA
jgi:hypothetical protein